jgi:prephenate dehydrogenase
MDVGSVKGPIVKALARRSPKGGPVFIGAHPMCGSEKTGVENARKDLYKGARCVLTPAPGTPPAAVKKAEAFWRGVGAQVLRLSPEEHDRRVAVVSHLPHLLADALVLSARKEKADALAAGSFRDATRVADADPALWAQIFSMNRPALLRAVSLFQGHLRRLARRPTAAALSRVRRERRALSGAVRRSSHPPPAS